MMLLGGKIAVARVGGLEDFTPERQPARSRPVIAASDRPVDRSVVTFVSGAAPGRSGTLPGRSELFEHVQVFFRR